MPFYVHRDHLNSGGMVTTNAGSIADRVAFSAHGKVLYQEAATNAGPAGSPGGLEEKFTGKNLDPETGLYYFECRYYDPELGIFTSPDSMVPDGYRSQDFNRYMYCRGNPVVFIDPTGHEPTKVLAGNVKIFIDAMNSSPSRVGLSKHIDSQLALMYLGETTVRWSGIIPKPEPANTPYFNMVKGRYVYTKVAGWIDMVHFLFYAGKAYRMKMNGLDFPLERAVLAGYIQERLDGSHSRFSYEDMPSNYFGAYFATVIFDPNRNTSLGEQINWFLVKMLGATEPESAPNWNKVPNMDDGKSPPSQRNFTIHPMYNKFKFEWPFGVGGNFWRSGVE